MVLLAALATIGVAGYVANQLGAQTPSNAPTSTKVGTVNLISVLKGYNKHKTYTAEVDVIRLQFEKKDTDLRKLGQQWNDYLSNPNGGKAPLTAEEKAKAEATIKDIKRRIEDNIEEGKKAINKKSDEMQVQCYKEIEEAVKSFAAPNGFHLIFLLSDADNPADKYTPQNIARKMNGTLQSAGVVPMYMAPGIDVSNDVVNMLNRMYPAPAASVPATSPAKTGG
jgi:Skp family chaperone for outer membrane proteins